MLQHFRTCHSWQLQGIMSCLAGDKWQAMNTECQVPKRDKTKQIRVQRQVKTVKSIHKNATQSTAKSASIHNLLHWLPIVGGQKQDTLTLPLIMAWTTITWAARCTSWISPGMGWPTPGSNHTRSPSAQSMLLCCCCVPLAAVGGAYVN